MGTDEESDLTMLTDIIMIYLAAVSTTQITVNNVCKYVHMNKYKHVKEKLIAEIDSLMAFEPWDSEGNLINHDKLLDACSYEKIQENFEYTMMCFRESLRMEPPVGFSTSSQVTRDVTLCKGTAKQLTINKGEMIHFLFNRLHHNKAQW